MLLEFRWSAESGKGGACDSELEWLLAFQMGIVQSPFCCSSCEARRMVRKFHGRGAIFLFLNGLITEELVAGHCVN